MALFDFFRKLNFFKDRSTDGLQEEDLDFQKWIAAHRNWRHRLLTYIDGLSTEELDEKIISCDDRCDLGKWIHGNGRRFYGSETTFRQLQTDHAHFHRAAGEVIVCYKQHGERDAKRALNGEFDRYSMHVVTGLEKLEQRVKQ
ncbi:MAG: CZB domain-containing protein [Dechloromonas sp.]|nr:CZB domain-containing protein [Dechloromonas sp.]